MPAPPKASATVRASVVGSLRSTSSLRQKAVPDRPPLDRRPPERKPDAVRLGETPYQFFEAHLHRQGRRYFGSWKPASPEAKGPLLISSKSSSLSRSGIQGGTPCSGSPSPPCRPSS